MKTITLDETLLSEKGIPLLRPDTPGYDSARTLWNAMIDRRPRLIVQPRNTAEVATAVRFALANDLPIAVKGGGHSTPGYSMCGDDGIVVDLALMNLARVDPATKRAYVQGGASLSALDAATAEHGLVVPAGAISHTGAGGLVLGGGFGHLMRKFGLSIDSLIAVEMVLADATVVSADADTHADLFWAVRGGSGNFGIVTEFVFSCHDFGPNVFVSATVFEPDAAWQALSLWRATMEEAPDELTWMVAFRGAPDLPGFDWIPERLKGTPIVIAALLWAGNPTEGQAYIEAITNTFDDAAAEFAAEVPFVMVQQMYDQVFVRRRHYAKAGFLSDVPDSALEALLEAVKNLPHPYCQIEVMRLGGAVARVPEDATAFPHRRAKWPINIVGLWDESEEDARGIAWVRNLYAHLEPSMSGGSYVNYAGGDETGGTKAAYGGTWDRLTALKEIYDPDNLFRFNANLSRSAPSR